MERQLKLWHLVIGLAVAATGNLIAIGAWVGKQAATVNEIRQAQEKQDLRIRELAADMVRIDRDGVQLVDLKLRMSRVEDKLDRIEPKLSELIGELRNGKKLEPRL